MAKIPMGDFGYRQAQLSTGAPSSPYGAEMAALGNFGDTLQKVAGQQIQINKREQDDADKAGAALALTKAENEKNAEAIKLRDGVLSGSLTQEDASKQWESSLSDISDRNFSTLKDQYKSVATNQVESWKGGGLNNLAETGIQFTRNKVTSDINGIEEQIMLTAHTSRDAAMLGVDKYNAVIDTVGESSSMTPEMRQRKKEDVARSVWYGQATQEIMGADNEGLKRAAIDLEKDNGFYSSKLDPKDRSALANMAKVEFNRRDAISRGQEGAAKALANQELSVQISMMERGETIPMQAEGRAVTSLNVLGADHPTVKQYEQAMKMAPVMSKLATEPLYKQAMAVTAMEGQVQTAASQDSTSWSEARQMADSAQRLYQTNLRDANADPVGYIASRFDKQPPPLDPNLLLTSPEEFKKQLDARRVYSEEAYQLSGVQTGTIFKQEVETFKAAFDSGGATSRVAVAKALAQTMGDDTQTSKNLLTIGSASPVLGAAAAAYKDKRKMPSGADLGDYILKGDSALNANKDMEMNAFQRQQFERLFVDKAGNSLGMISGDVHGRTREAAEKAYYGMLDEANMRGKRDSLDTDKAKQVIRAAVGNTSKFNGEITLIPEGLDSSDFNKNAKDAMSRIYADLTKSGATNMPTEKDFLNDYNLVQMPDGRYRVSMGNKYWAAQFKNSSSGTVDISIKGTK